MSSSRTKGLNVCVEFGYKQSTQWFKIYVPFVRGIPFYIPFPYCLHYLCDVQTLCHVIQVRVPSFKTNRLFAYCKRLSDPIKFDEFLDLMSNC